jgi:hypothetical protein
MKILGIEFGKAKKAEPVTQVVTSPSINQKFHSLMGNSVGIAEPYQSTRRNGSSGYYLGEDNLYPQLLNRLYMSAPLHSACINFKSLMTSGNGYTADEAALMANEKISWKQLDIFFKKNLNEMTTDHFLHNRVYVKLYWNEGFTKVIKFERVAPEKIRIYELKGDMSPASYLYNYDWVYSTHYKTEVIPAYDSLNKTDRVQMIEFNQKTPGFITYSTPTYQSGVNWIVTASEYSTFQKMNIIQSLSPSMLIQFYQVPGSAEEESSVLHSLNKSFGGARNAGRLMTTFSNSKEEAPTITQLEPTKLDDAFLQLSDVIQREICFAHSIDPQILGLRTPGSLGNSNELVSAIQIFQKTTIEPAQKFMDNMMNELALMNGISINIKLNNVYLLDIK